MKAGADARIIGITGWSGSGKTTLIIKLLPELVALGLRVATLKHAHHDFDVDLPGKDSYEHRKAGASEVIVASSRRWAQMHELGEEGEASLSALLRRLSPCDLVLIEGYKREHHPKIEIYRQIVGKPLRQPDDPTIVAIASDVPVPEATVDVIDLDDVNAVAAAIVEKAKPFDTVLDILEKT